MAVARTCDTAFLDPVSIRSTSMSRADVPAITDSLSRNLQHARKELRSTFLLVCIVLIMLVLEDVMNTSVALFSTEPDLQVSSHTTLQV